MQGEESFVLDKLFTKAQDQLMYQRVAIFNKRGSIREKYHYKFPQFYSVYQPFIKHYHNNILHDQDYEHPTDFCIEILKEAVLQIQVRFKVNICQNSELIWGILFGKYQKNYGYLINSIQSEYSDSKRESPRRYKDLTEIWNQMLYFYEASTIQEGLINYKWQLKKILLSSLCLSDNYQRTDRMQRLIKQLQPIYQTELILTEVKQSKQIQSQSFHEIRLITSRYDTADFYTRKQAKIALYLDKQFLGKQTTNNTPESRYSHQLQSEEVLDIIFEAEEKSKTLEEILKFYQSDELLSLLGKQESQSRVSFTVRLREQLVRDLLEQLLQLNRLTKTHYPGIIPSNILFNSSTRKFILKIEPIILEYGIGLDLCDFSLPFFKSATQKSRIKDSISEVYEDLITCENYCERIMRQNQYFTNRKQLTNNFTQLLLLLQYWDQCTQSISSSSFKRGRLFFEQDDHFLEGRQIDELIHSKISKKQTWSQIFPVRNVCPKHHDSIVDKFGSLYRLDQYLGYPSLMSDTRSTTQYKLFARIKILVSTQKLLAEYSCHQIQIDQRNKLRRCLNLQIMLASLKLYLFSSDPCAKEFTLVTLQQISNLILKQSVSGHPDKAISNTSAILINYYLHIKNKIKQFNNKQQDCRLNPGNLDRTLNLAIDFRKLEETIQKYTDNHFRLLSMKILMLSDLKPNESCRIYLKTHFQWVNIALKSEFWRLSYLYMLYSLHLRLNDRNVENFHYLLLRKFCKIFKELGPHNERQLQIQFALYDKSIQIYQIDF